MGGWPKVKELAFCIYDLSSNLFCIGKQIIIGRNVVCDSVLDLSY